MADPIRVVFVDAATGVEFARSDVPLAQLPDTFAPATTLHLGEDAWTVVASAPASKPEFARSGRLVLTLSRERTVDPRDVRFSLPTICDVLPPATGTASVNTFVLHEDDWRQVELVSAALAEEIRGELRAVQEIVERHASTDAEGRPVGFDDIHVRRVPGAPLQGGIAARELWELLPRPEHVYDGVGFRGATGVAEGSFAGVLGPVVLYGLTAGGRVTVLGLTGQSGHAAHRAATEDAAAGLERVLGAFRLYAVDWCRGAVADAGTVRDLLAGSFTR
ncbi:MAG: hypothetical protein GEV11_11835 [Streptosporangiales bacterium]|nr:hypothetical protein [Streptosporangiales bacterium]